MSVESVTSEWMRRAAIGRTLPELRLKCSCGMTFPTSEALEAHCGGDHDLVVDEQAQALEDADWCDPFGISRVGRTGLKEAD